MALSEYQEGSKGLTRPVTDLESQAAKFFHELIQAKTEWDDACQNLQHAYERRNQAESVLRQLTDQAQKVLQLNLLDPTEPVPAQGAPIPIPGMNGGTLQRQKY